MLSHMGSIVNQMMIKFLRLSLWVNAITVIKFYEIPKVLICPVIMSSPKILIIKMCVIKITKFPCQLHCNELSSESHQTMPIFESFVIYSYCSDALTKYVSTSKSS